MKYLFVVQGEGRGHFTQALSLKHMLERNGHQVVAVMVGSSAKRTLPAFFTEKLDVEIVRFLSPNFMPTPKGKKSFLLASILYNLLLLPAYITSLFAIRKTILQQQPDVVVNFYELLCGITYGVFNPDVPMINIAHQYYFTTSEFNYTGEKKREFQLLNFYSNLTSLNASKVLALSFRKRRIYSDIQDDGISVVPPLLRSEVLNQRIINGNYIHGYMVNSGYADELVSWSKAHSTEKLHFFWDKKNAPLTTALSPTLTMHTLDDKLFLEFMAGAKGYATTAGFESVCEAMYLQKPVLMVPTHIEQECNAIDAMQSNAGVTANSFELESLTTYIPTYQPSVDFRYWINAAETIFMHELTHLESEITNVLVPLS